MRIVEKTVERYEIPVPVYDVTNLDGNDNFVLANGVVVHNCLKDKTGKSLESDEIISILAAIGFDVNAADPYAKLNVGKIVCLADPDPDGPFVADTQIRIRALDDGDIGMTPHDTEIWRLVNRKFEVPVWHQGKEVWAEATAQLERNVNTLVALEIGGTKYKVTTEHKWLVHSNVPTMRGRACTESRFEGLVFVRSQDLRIGDRVFMPSNNGSRKPSEADKLTKLGFAPVSKMRIQQLSEPVPVYCLTVPKYHDFILPSGIVSSNCHINSLLLTLFYRYLPDLFERGMVYVMNAPEFYATFKKDGKTQVKIGDRLSKVQDKLKEAGAPTSTDIRHVKGYGELPAPLMRLMCMDPATRRLIRIKAIESEDRTDFIRLMNDDVEYRRDMLGLPKDAAEATDDTKSTAKESNAAQDEAVAVEQKKRAGKKADAAYAETHVKKTAVNKAKTTLKKAA